jgi:hypothetical protein
MNCYQGGYRRSIRSPGRNRIERVATQESSGDDGDHEASGCAWRFAAGRDDPGGSPAVGRRGLPHWGFKSLARKTGPVSGLDCGAGTVRSKREAVTVLPLVSSHRHAAARLARPDPRRYCGSLPSVCAVHVVRAAGLPGTAASPGPRNARAAAPVVLTWTGDRSPVRGCTTSVGVQVPPRPGTPPSESDSHPAGARAAVITRRFWAAARSADAARPAPRGVNALVTTAVDLAPRAAPKHRAHLWVRKRCHGL